MSKILKHLKPMEWLQMLVILIFIMLEVWLDLKLPDYMRGITRLLQTQGSQMGEIWTAGGYMILCALGSLACVVIVSFFTSRTAAALAMRLRDMIFYKVESFSMEEMTRFSTSSLITRSTNDIMQVQIFFISGLQMLLKTPILAVGGIMKIAGRGSEWTLATVVTVSILAVLISCIIAAVMPQFRKIQSLIDNLNLTIKESLTGRHVVRAYNAEDYQEDKFEAANEAFTYADKTTNRAMSPFMPAMFMATNFLTLAIYWIGAYLINAAGTAESLILFSNMVVFSAYAMQILNAVKFIVKVVPRYPRAAVSARRINEVLETEPLIKDGRMTEGKPGIVGEVVFKNVSFRYPGAAKNVLDGISFTARQGETVAFIGSTGSGKSTLVNLVPRLFDAVEGQVLVDGINVKDYKQEALNNKIGYIPQNAVLFNGTVSSNVTYGDNGKGGYSGDDVRKAVHIAQGDEFVGKMEGGYEAAISQGGTNISGGQKQRVSIARAICRSPEIFIFDDTFSALDYKTDRVLRSELKKETTGSTSLIVAQRIGTIMDADQIIVLDEGKIVGTGTHRELLETCRVYKEIAMSQLSEEELAS